MGLELGRRGSDVGEALIVKEGEVRQKVCLFFFFFLSLEITSLPKVWSADQQHQQLLGLYEKC